jgi:hypothetical protein
MDDILIFDNIIPKRQSEYILDSIFTDSFPWYFMPKIVDPNGESNYQNVSGFNHFLLEDNKKVSQYFDMFYPIVMNVLDKQEVTCNQIIRMRLNLHSCHPDTKMEYHLPHIDSFFPHMNMICYLNDSDGDTFIFNEVNEHFNTQYDSEIVSNNKFTIKKRITPKMGRCVVFDGRYYHSSSYPKKSLSRCVMNVNLATIKL